MGRSRRGRVEEKWALDAGGASDLSHVERLIHLLASIASTYGVRCPIFESKADKPLHSKAKWQSW